MKPVSYRASVGKYVIGFCLSLALSVAAYFLVVDQKISAAIVVLVILLLAVVQALIQLRFFLHLSAHERSSLRLNSLVYTVCTLLILVGGSLWIMHNLDYRMGMSPEAMQQYMLEQNKKGF